MLNTNKKRKRTKRLTKNQLLTILSDYAMIRACDDGYERARTAGKTPSAMFRGVCRGDRRWFFLNLVSHSNVKDADAVRLLGLREVLFSLRKDLIAEFTPIVKRLLQRYDRTFPLGTYSNIRRLLVSTLDALRFPDAHKRPKALVEAMSKVRFLRDTPNEFSLDHFVHGEIDATRDAITRWPTQLNLVYFLRSVLCILSMGHADNFKRNSTVLAALHNMNCRFSPTVAFDGAPMYSQDSQDRINVMLTDYAARVPWTRYERLLRKVFPKV